MICKIWQWKGTKGWDGEAEYSSTICTTSPIKTRKWGKSFIHYVGTEYIHARLRVLSFEMLLFWKTYDISNDRIITALRFYWRGQRVAGLDHRH